ncbi:efflux RND transporter periplasmic adaptor subunit [Dethiobacter alkaliphilus]|uniref:efflux RND transporter periplasmic adaptor subunit n=1 Tax=Dethiobacter alkaliphilus TaxID=427926 RepID=UPI0022271C69|nr:efflux RND transporter periplasmic adaptor subunit [Dethiobacter alkaliphilus]MCW3488507.1 efflux RND transporter periplasmic adaptor subunit [Dethiobacter alkaliphilus]
MKKSILTLVILVSVALLAAGCTGTTEAGTNGQEEVEVVQAQTVEAFGNVVALAEKNIIVDFPALVEEVHVREGQQVEEEETLITLDLTEYNAQIENKERELKIARLELDRTSGTTLRNMQRERIAALELELSLLEEKLAKSYLDEETIIADFKSGVIYDIVPRPGDMLTPGSKVFSVMELDNLTVEANIFEEFIKDVEIGAAVTIIPLADRTQEYQGEVTAISAKAINQNGETVVPVQISITDNDGFLKPNFNVDVIIEM